MERHTGENTKDEIRAFYDKVSEKYAEELNHEIEKKPLDQKFIEYFLEKLRESYGLTELLLYDIGCGSGEIARFIHSRSYEGVIVKGLDLSDKMIGEAKKLLPEIDFHLDDVCNLSLTDESVHGMLAFYMIVNLSEEQVLQAFKEIFRVLKSGGFLLLSFHISEWPNIQVQTDGRINMVKLVDELFGVRASLNFFFYSPTLIERLLQDAGFALDVSVTRTPNPDVEYPSNRAYIFAKKA